MKYRKKEKEKKRQ